QQIIYSHHTFMLPFIIENEEYLKDKKMWEHKKYSDYKDSYNETAYFHSFFKDSMFTNKEEDNSSFYKHKEYQNSELIISKSKEYNLNLKSVNLRIFKTCVGILSFHIENKEHKEIEEILEINDFGRRIYPEYLDDKLKCNLVPNFIQLGDIKEDFTYQDKPSKIKLSKIITNFLHEDKIRHAVDDRMFAVSFYKNDKFSNDLKRDYIKNDDWYRYVYIDGDGKTVQNSDMQTELIRKATYPRWQGYGTMYGLSKYSFVCAANNSNFIKYTVEVHMQTIYFQMFSLLLMVRATILKFSSEVSVIAKNIELSDTSQKVSDLYERYIQFVNSFYFREITAKDQGLELYEKALDILNIPRDIKDLDAEIEELHRYIELKEEAKNSKKMDRLQYLGFPMIFLSLIVGFFGMNILPKEWEHTFRVFLENIF
nr:hypothetical protein [Sulfurovaceae bacterium]